MDAHHARAGPCLARERLRTHLSSTFNEHELLAAGIHDVVLDACGPGVGLPELQIGDRISLCGLRQKLPGSETDNDVVVRVAMPSGLSA